MTAERRWIIGLVIALTVSLAGNLLVAGVVASHWFDDRPPPPVSLANPYMVEGLFEDLSPEGRDVLRNSLRGARRDLKDTFRELHGARRELRRLMVADPFDRAAFEAATARMTALGDAVEHRMQQAFTEAVSQMSLEDRQHFKPGRPPRPERDRRDRERDRDGPPPEGPRQQP